MKLIKCDKCGRPYYDNEVECPYCGHSTSSSDNISKPEINVTEVDIMPDIIPVHERPIIPEENNTPSEAVLSRAEAMANLAEKNPQIENDYTDAAPDEADTIPLPRKRRGWIWLVVIVFLLAIGCVVYLKWDFLCGIVSSHIR